TGTAGGAGGGSVITDGGSQLNLDRDALEFNAEFGAGIFPGTTPINSLSVTRGGTASITLMSATLGGTDPGAFTVTTDPLPAAVNPQLSIQVAFNPTQARAYSATLTLVSSNAPTRVVSLSGTGVTGGPFTPGS